MHTSFNLFAINAVLPEVHNLDIKKGANQPLYNMLCEERLSLVAVRLVLAQDFDLQQLLSCLGEYDPDGRFQVL
jgi:hypothetical protein